MDSWWGLIWTLVALVLFSQLIGVVIIAARLIRLTLQAPVSTSVPNASIPEDVLLVLDAAQPLLEKEGFQFLQMRQSSQMIVTPFEVPAYCAIYHHPERNIHAQVMVAPEPTARWPFVVYLWNIFEEGRVLLTTNGQAHQLIPYPKAYTVVDPFSPSFAGQLAAHLAARDAITAPALRGDLAWTALCDLGNDLLAQMERDGFAYRRAERNGEPLYGLKFAAASKLAWRMRSGMARRQKMEAPPDNLKAPPDGGDTRPAEATVAVRQAAEKLAFLSTLGVLRSFLAPRWFRWSTFALTAGLFLLVATWVWGLGFAVAIALVILVHEAGHWLAMRLSHFRDVQVFFVPGMGAATSGEKHEAPPLTHMFVYLAGPLPGLLLALGAFAWIVLGQPDMSSTAVQIASIWAAFAFLINMLNLLPILPLDGGRVVELLVMSKLPWLRFVFSLASAVGLLAFGFSIDDKVLIALGVVLLFAVPHQYQLARLAREVLRSGKFVAGHELTFSEAASRLYGLLSEAKFAAWPYSTKISLGASILPRVLGRLPRASEVWSGLGIYLASIAIPVAALIALTVTDAERMQLSWRHGFSPQKLVQIGTPDADQATQSYAAYLETGRTSRQAKLQAAAPEKRLAILKEMVDEAHEAEDYDDMLRLSKIFYAEAVAAAPDSLEHATAAKLQAQAILYAADSDTVAKAGHVRLFKESEDILRKRLQARPDRDDALLLAEVIEQTSADETDLNNLRRKEEVVKLFDAHTGSGDYRRITARISLAKSFDRAGSPELAEQSLRKANDEVDALPDRSTIYLAANLKLDYAWFLLSHDRFDEADAIVQPLLHTTGDNYFSSYLVSEVHMLKAAIARQRGDWNAVLQHAGAANAQKKVRYGSDSGWLTNLLLVAFQPKPVNDYRATLLLIDANRKAGNTVEADHWLSTLQEQDKKSANNARRCRIWVNQYDWRHVLDSALSEIEKRELGCKESSSYQCS